MGHFEPRGVTNCGVGMGKVTPLNVTLSPPLPPPMETSLPSIKEP